jgi:excisionase family DNA binding protein
MEMSTVEIPKGRYYGVQDAADAIGVTTGRIRQMIRWGELPAIKISAHAWIISEKDVQNAVKTRASNKK